MKSNYTFLELAFHVVFKTNKLIALLIIILYSTCQMNAETLIPDVAPSKTSSNLHYLTDLNGALLYSPELRNTQVSDISGFSLINARQNKTIKKINQGDTISLDQFNLYDFNIRADMEPREFTKLRFRLTGAISNTSTDSIGEFFVFGPGGRQAIAGSYTLTATPYYVNSSGAEVPGQVSSLSFILSSAIHVGNVRLVSSVNGAEIAKINYNTVVDKATYPLTGINILADVTAPQYNSVYFELTGPVSVSRLQNNAPFSLFGDTNGTLNQGRLEVGAYLLTVTPYVGKNRSGFAGKPYVVPFTVVDQLKVSNLRLVDAQTGTQLNSITEGTVLDPAPLPTEDIAIVADVPNPNVNSVRFELTGPVFMVKLQNNAPYAVFGKNNGALLPRQLPKGNYTLTATTYRQANQKGKAGEPVVIHFTKKYDPGSACATVNAGDNIVTCGFFEGGELFLHATVNGNYGSITWSTNGFGNFDVTDSLNPVYYYNATDVNYANIELYARIQSAQCDSYTDTLSVYFQAAPSVEFPQPFVQQMNQDPVPASVYLYGFASSGTWSTTGSGSFSDPNSTESNYYPSNEDAIHGCVELIFTTNDPDGDCGPASGSMTACFNPPCPSIGIGDDMTICGYLSGGAVSLTANVSGNAEGISWGSSGNGFFDDPNSYSPTYYYSEDDVNNAQIDIVASVSNSGCYASDVLTVYLQAAPALEFPTPSVNGCSGTTVYANVFLYGYASSGTWTTSGTGTFEDPTATYTAYTPGPDEVGCVLFTFTSNDPDGPCSATSGTMEACFDDCSGVLRTNSDARNISVYPNPSANQLTLQTNLDINKSAVFITDITGKRVEFSWAAEQINISDLPAGSYILHASSERGRSYAIHFVKL